MTMTMPNKMQTWNKCARIFEDKTVDDIQALLFDHFGYKTMGYFCSAYEPPTQGDNNELNDD